LIHFSLGLHRGPSPVEKIRLILVCFHKPKPELVVWDEVEYFKNQTPNQVTGTKTEKFEKTWKIIIIIIIGGLTRGQPAINRQLQAGLPETRSEHVLNFRTKTRIIIIF
jgi:hypothetical protein